LTSVTMPKLNIEDIGSQPEVATRLTNQFDDLIDRVRRRAYELFAERRGDQGSDLEDWLRAEEELLFPAKFAVIQEPGSYNLALSLPALASQNLRLYHFKNGLIVNTEKPEVHSEADNQSANGSRSIFYWWPLPVGADVPGITAGLKHNRLEINIPILRRSKPVETESLGKETDDSTKTAAA
jgi:HSP20 family molecular chaperone IbpA